MSLRRDRGMPAFPPDERGLGGSHQILDDYRNFFHKVSATGRINTDTLRNLRAQGNGQSVSMAEKLSINRARRKACVDRGAVEHINNVYHLNRRIEDLYSVTERKKNPWDVRLLETTKKGQSSHQASSIVEQLKAWAPQPSMPRPHSAPGQAKSKDAYEGWSIKKPLPATFPASQLLLRQRHEIEANIYKKAIMQEIIENRLYKEHDLKRLFRAYIKLAPIGDKQTVEDVVAQLKKELDVS